jgi:hypothetical protein
MDQRYVCRLHSLDSLFPGATCPFFFTSFFFSCRLAFALSLALVLSMSFENGKMEEDVEPKDEDGVDGRRVCGWDGWVGGLGEVGASSIFGLSHGLVLRVGAFAAVLPTFVLVSRM